MKNVLKTAAIAIASFSLFACNNPKVEPPKPTPDPVPELTDNSMIYDAQKVVLQSIIVDTEGNAPLLTIFASPKAGITSIKQMKENEHIYLSILPTDINKVLDVKKVEDFMFENTSTLCPSINHLNPSELTKLSAGTIKFTMANLEGGQVKAEFDFTLADGAKHFKGILVGTYTPTPVEQENYIAYDEQAVDFKSIVLTDAAAPGTLCLLASEKAGLSTYEEMLASDETGFINKPLMIVVELANLNSTIDVINAEGKMLQINNFTGVGADIQQFQTGMPDESNPIKSGSITFTHNAVGQVTALFNLVSKETGKILISNITGVFTPSPTPMLDQMALNGEVVAIASKYVKIDNVSGNRTLYFSPLTVTAEEIGASNHYATLMMNESIMSGNDKDITALGAGQFEFSYYNTDAIGFQTKVTIRPDALQGATGKIAGSENGTTGAITMNYEITIGDNILTGQIDKVLTPYSN